MRLFIAINFSEGIKEALAAYRDQLRAAALQGNFTRTENLHLTLAFIGETPDTRVAALKNSMDTVSVPAFTMHINRAGQFGRSGGAIWWAGIEPNESLTRLNRELVNSLSAAHFPVDQKPFTPHLTLAREAMPIDKKTLPWEEAPNIIVSVEAISLMCSQRIKKVLTYAELYRRLLA